MKNVYGTQTLVLIMALEGVIASLYWILHFLVDDDITVGFVIAFSAMLAGSICQQIVKNLAKGDDIFTKTFWAEIEKLLRNLADAATE
jgi:hypothetical protein